MKPEISPSAPPSPSHWASVLEAPQSPVKDLNSILAWVELDLNGEMRFEKSLLCLIPTGLFWTDGTRSEFWPMSSETRLLQGDHAGVGHLKLESETSLLRLWYLTNRHLHCQVAMCGSSQLTEICAALFLERPLHCQTRPPILCTNMGRCCCLPCKRRCMRSFRPRCRRNPSIASRTSMHST